MSNTTNIEWADSTFNPWIGCTKVSPACDHCYAERDTKRFGRVEWGAGKPRVRTSPANWKLPERWNAAPFYRCTCGWRGDAAASAAHRCDGAATLSVTRRRTFCASLADWLDNEVPIEWLVDLLDLIRRTPNLDWLLLTKRIGNWRGRIWDAIKFIETDAKSWGDNQMLQTREWLLGWHAKGLMPTNVWLGATVINQAEADRDVPKLLAVPARVRFLSIEPMLADVTLDPSWITRWPNRQADVNSPHAALDWIIAGGESGPHARPMHPDWVRSLRDQCEAAGLPFLFKQHGEWLATDFCSDEDVMLPSRRTVYINRDGSYVDGTEGFDFFAGFEETAWVGKKAAGRQLDGRTHDGFPVKES